MTPDDQEGDMTAMLSDPAPSPAAGDEYTAVLATIEELAKCEQHVKQLIAKRNQQLRDLRTTHNPSIAELRRRTKLSKSSLRLILDRRWRD
jgi:hypothetical protein